MESRFNRFWACCLLSSAAVQFLLSRSEIGIESESDVQNECPDPPSLSFVLFSSFFVGRPFLSFSLAFRYSLLVSVPCLPTYHSASFVARSTTALTFLSRARHETTVLTPEHAPDCWTRWRKRRGNRTRRQLNNANAGCTTILTSTPVALAAALAAAAAANTKVQKGPQELK